MADQVIVVNHYIPVWAPTRAIAHDFAEQLAKATPARAIAVLYPLKLSTRLD